MPQPLSSSLHQAEGANTLKEPRRMGLNMDTVTPGTHGHEWPRKSLLEGAPRRCRDC